VAVSGGLLIQVFLPGNIRYSIKGTTPSGCLSWGLGLLLRSQGWMLFGQGATGWLWIPMDYGDQTLGQVWVLQWDQVLDQQCGQAWVVGPGVDPGVGQGEGPGVGACPK
jgi:hypothetical protein